MSDLLAAFLYGQVEHMESITERRRKIWNRYHEALQPMAGSGSVQLPVVPVDCVTNCHMYAIRVPDGAIRAEMIELLRQRGILAVFHYVPLHQSPMAQKKRLVKRESPGDRS